MRFQACSMLCHILTILSTVMGNWWARCICEEPSESSRRTHLLLRITYFVGAGFPRKIDRFPLLVCFVVYSLEQRIVSIPKVFFFIHGVLDDRVSLFPITASVDMIVPMHSLG